MSGIEIVGVVLGSLPLLIGSVEHYTNSRTELALNIAKYRSWKNRFSKVRSEYGLVAALLFTFIIPEVLPLMEKIERDVLVGDPQRAISFMEAQTSSLNMIALAGAIIAQVAITALGLTRLSDSHWTSEAFFITSLVYGILSVFFACLMHPSTRGLFNAPQIRDWLSKPTTAKDKAKIYAWLQRLEIFLLLSQDSRPNVAVLEELEQKLWSHRWKLASCYAAIMLVIPARLLTLSLSYFVIGLGIYIGKMYTANLIPEYGTGSLAILIIFVVTMVAALMAFYIPSAMKRDESSVYERLEELLRVNDLNRELVPTTEPDAGTRQHWEIEDSSRPVELMRSHTDTIAHHTKQDIEAVAHGGHEATTEIHDATPLPVQSTRFFGFEPKDSVVGSSRVSKTDALDFEAVLKDLLKAQQDSVVASQRLLELYQNDRS